MKTENMEMVKKASRDLSFLVLAFFLLAASSIAQSTSFTYQGRLTDGGLAASGTYDFQFGVFDAGGTMLTPLVPYSGVPVTNGIFTVELNFGSALFSGDERFLQINIKKPTDSVFTPLSPRQPITSSPYAIKSLNAATADDTSSLGGVPATEFVRDSDPRMTDSRDPSPGSESYIQNTPTQQASANFNISGTGTANAFDALTEYKINGLRVLGTPTGTQNTVAGVLAGAANGGNFNSFFGYQAGLTNSMGGGNAFFGTQAGLAHTTGIANSFFGRSSGIASTEGNSNSFFGVSSGAGTTTGNANTFVGSTAGFANSTGSNNTAVGAGTNLGSANLSFATAIGAQATVSTSNTIVLGRSNGSDTVEIPGTGRANLFDATTQYNIRDGRLLGIGGELFGNFTSLYVGINAGSTSSAGISNTFVGRGAGFANSDGDFNSFFGYSSGSSNTLGNNNSFFGYQAGTSNTTGISNSFFGWSSGNANVDGERNAFFGAESGNVTTGGQGNSFFGYSAGNDNTTGSLNSFFGHLSGLNNETGSMNSFFGHFTGQTPENSTRVTLLGAFSDAADNLDFATAIGAHAVVTTSNTIVLGRINGADKIVIPGLGTGGDAILCWNADLQVSSCVSSLRFKTNIKPFTSGLDLVKRLQPITFDWTTNGKNDLGLGAEDVAKIEPLLATYNKKGQVEGVKYDRIGVVLLNAVKEQQEQIDRQQNQINEQKTLIDGLRQLVCAAANQKAAVCANKEDQRNEK